MHHTYAANHYSKNKDFVLLVSQPGHHLMEITCLNTKIDDPAIERLEQRQLEDSNG
ncbi:hypothetical protein KQI67_29735 [Bacillus albus]|uniref:hypothetical protein n=1 Tax=Bacillus TaxID=1386 RepID=UPI0014199DE6|nr:hypothetical protein [Bacillus albus]MBU5220739.1 hypothetical protein [Bacillus albus]